MIVSTTKIDLIIARPIESHAKKVMEWRNDPVSLEMSIHEEKKIWPEFLTEFTEMLEQEIEAPSFFLSFQKELVAFVYFRPLFFQKEKPRKSCEISLVVSPEFRGKGIGKEALTFAKDWLFTKGYDDIYALIKEKNGISLKLFSSLGYSFLETVEYPLENGKKIPLSLYHEQLTPATLSKKGSVFIIAEAGSNWKAGSQEEDLTRAKELIHAAKESGADAIKFQTFKPDTIYAPEAGKAKYLEEKGISSSMQELFSSLAMPYEMIPELAEICKREGIVFLSSPFSPADFEAIDSYVPFHKLASYELKHLRLIEKMAKSKKPLLMSTGANNEEDIAWAVNIFRENGGKDLFLLQCTSKYPAPLDSMNLRVIPWLKKRFFTGVGLSDHSRHPTFAPIAAVSLGATVIEKHFTLDNTFPGPDHFFSLLPYELKEMVKAIRETENVLGDGRKTIHPVEEELYHFARRAIHAKKDIQKDEIFKEDDNISILRSGSQKPGIHPKWILEIHGKKAKRDIKAGEGIQNGDW